MNWHYLYFSHLSQDTLLRQVIHPGNVPQKQQQWGDLSSSSLQGQRSSAITGRQPCSGNTGTEAYQPFPDGKRTTVSNQSVWIQSAWMGFCFLSPQCAPYEVKADLSLHLLGCGNSWLPLLSPFMGFSAQPPLCSLLSKSYHMLKLVPVLCFFQLMFLCFTSILKQGLLHVVKTLILCCWSLSLLNSYYDQQTLCWVSDCS